MTCPMCGGNIKTQHTHDNDDHTTRRRKCVEFGYLFRTIEIDLDLYERMMRTNEQSRSFRSR